MPFFYRNARGRFGELAGAHACDFIQFKEFPKPKYPDGVLIHWIIDKISGTIFLKW